MSASLSPLPKLQFFDANGNPLVGGRLYTFAAGTTTPLDTYTDNTGTIAASNPIVLNGRGECEVWLGSAPYKFRLETSAGVEVWTVDNVTQANADQLQYTPAATSLLNGVVTTVSGALNELSHQSTGSTRVGFLQAGTGAQVRTAQSKLRDVVSAFDFMTSAQIADVQARTALVDVTAAIQAAFNSLGNGGEVFFPAGVYRISSMVTMPIGSTLSGSGMTREGSGGVTQGGTVIYQSGAAFALKANRLCNIRDVSVWGRLGLGLSGSVAIGGIFWENAGFGTMTNVAVEYFPALNAVAIKVHECYRLQFNYVHIYSVYHGLQTSGNVTTFQWNKGNVSRTNDFNVGTGRALDFSGGPSPNNTEIEFNGVYFESCFGANPIYADQTTRIKFDFCGFEAMCVNESYAGTVTNPIMIDMVNPAVCDITNCQWSGWYTPGQTFAGTLTFLRARGSGFTISDSSFTQNYSLGGLSAVCVNSQDFRTRLTITNNIVQGAGFTTELAAKRWLLSNAATYPSRNFTAYGNRFKSASDTVAVFSAADVFPVGNNGVPAGIVPVTVTGTATTIVYSTTVPRELLRSGHGLKLRAWGRRTGTVGSKQATLLITDTGAATSINITGAITAANSWGSNIVIYCRDSASQSVNAQSIDSSTALNISQILFEDFAANDMLLELQLAVATAAETMTLDGLVLEAF